MISARDVRVWLCVMAIFFMCASTTTVALGPRGHQEDNHYVAPTAPPETIGGQTVGGPDGSSNTNSEYSLSQSSANNNNNNNNTDFQSPGVHKVVEVDVDPILNPGVWALFYITLICGALGVVVIFVEAVCMAKLHHSRKYTEDLSSGTRETVTNMG